MSEFISRYAPLIPVPEPKTFPFFVKARLRGPKIQLENNHLYREIIANWKNAEIDLAKMAKSSYTGRQIEDLFTAQALGHNITLKDVANSVGVISTKRASDVRSALNVGELVSKTHIGVWKFTEMELAQLLIGLVAYRGRMSYVQPRRV